MSETFLAVVAILILAAAVVWMLRDRVRVFQLVLKGLGLEGSVKVESGETPSLPSTPDTKLQATSTDATPVQNGNIVVAGERGVAAGGNISGPIVTGDNSIATPTAPKRD
ncbi:hypothetical protein [Thalassobaculum salexigens]|uniref:hypothetical protein n=1 Tax=Thalassobaculum salexigens TaxID=455360 RepID=UPI00048A7710|nr:hypothetical protein [Thalassobaculum salexigens]